LIHSIAIFL